MTASISCLQSALNFFPNRIFELLRLFPNTWILPPFQWTNINLYNVTSSCILISRHDHVLLSAFTSSPLSLLATTKASVYFFVVCTLPPNILKSSAWTKSWCVPFNFKPTRFTWTLLMAYFKAKLKGHGDKSSPCFKPF